MEPEQRPSGHPCPIAHCPEKISGFYSDVRVSLHYMHYNFARPHQTLTTANGGHKTTPAMAAGITNRVWTHRDIAALLD